jgi:hypothetical protein
MFADIIFVGQICAPASSVDYPKAGALRNITWDDFKLSHIGCFWECVLIVLRKENIL